MDEATAVILFWALAGVCAYLVLAALVLCVFGMTDDDELLEREFRQAMERRQANILDAYELTDRQSRAVDLEGLK